VNTVELFSPDIADAVDGLAYLGHLEEEIRFCGHRFLIRTLKADEELSAALLAKEWQETFGGPKAHAWAHLAASIQAVDGNANFCPAIGPSQDAALRGKFNYITQNWYWPVGEYLFGKYVELVQRMTEAIAEVEDLSSRSLQTSWTTVNSSTQQTDSGTIPTDSNSESSAISPEQMKKLADEEE
jgi:hypothetical protein